MRKSKLKLFALALAPLLAIGMASCTFVNPDSPVTSTSTTTTDGGSSSTDSSITSSDSTDSTDSTDSSDVTSSDSSSSSDVTSDSTDSSSDVTSSDSSSSEDSSSSDTPLVDEIEGTAQERYTAFNKNSNGDDVAFFGKYLFKEQFTSSDTCNMIFVDGEYFYRLTNYSKADAATMELGAVYKVSGVKQYTGVNGKNTPATVELVPDGESKITGQVITLSDTTTFIESDYQLVSIVDGVITGVEGDKLSVKVGTKTYTVESRGENETEIKNKINQGLEGQKVSISLGFVSNGAAAKSQIKVVDADVITYGEMTEDFVGTIAQDSDKTGKVYDTPLTVAISGTTITFGGVGERIDWSAADPDKGWATGANRIGVEIKAPRSAVLAETTIQIGSGTPISWQGASTMNTIYLEVTPAYTETITVIWKTGQEAQVFTVEVDSATQLVRDLVGTIGTDAAIGGYPTGSVSATDYLSYNVQDDTIVYGAEGEKVDYYENLNGESGNFVALVITKPEGCVDSEIVITDSDGETALPAWTAGEDTYTYYWKVTEPNSSKLLYVKWISNTGDYYANEQVIIMELHSGVKIVGITAGTIAADENSDVGGNPTGSLDADTPLSVNVNGNVITFGGTGEYIDWYSSDEGLGRTEGNRVGVVVSKPDDLDPTVDPYVFINGVNVGKWSAEDISNTGKIWWYPLITEENIGDEQTITINWNGEEVDTHAQTFIVKIESGTSLVGSFARSAVVSSTVDEFSKGGLTQLTQLYSITGVVKSVTNSSRAQGIIVDEATGAELMYYNLTNDKTIFYDYDPTTGSNPVVPEKNAPQVGDRITIVGVYVLYGTTNEIIGYVDNTVDKAEVTYTVHVTRTGEGSGSVVLNKDIYNLGDSATATITASEGSAIESVTYNGTTVQLNEGVYTFEITAGYHAIDVVFVVAVPVTVELPQVTNGTVALDKDSYLLGDTATLTVTPDEGYVISKLIINSVGEVVDEEGKVQFTVLETNSIEVEFSLPPSGEKSLELTTALFTNLTSSAASGTDTIGGIGFGWTLGRNFQNKIMINSGGTFYCTTSLGTIKSITIAYGAGGSAASNQTLYIGTTSLADGIDGAVHSVSRAGSTANTSYTFDNLSSYGCGFFRINISNKNLQAASITIVYEA